MFYNPRTRKLLLFFVALIQICKFYSERVQEFYMFTTDMNFFCGQQFRLTNGSTLTGTFQSTDTLETVCAYVNDNRTDGSTPFNLMTTFPRKTYSAGDLGTSLQDAGLVPSAVLILTKQ